MLLEPSPIDFSDLVRSISQIEAPPPEAPAPPAIENEQPPQTKPGGWRVVHKRPERKAIKGKQPAPPPAPSPAPVPVAAPVPEPTREVPAWAQWRRECLYLG
jgi:hypothetical protein